MRDVLQGSVSADDGVSVFARQMVTETKELPPQAARLIKRMQRGNEIMESQIDAAGNMLPFERWPRKLRREFSRLAGKAVGQ